MVPFISLVLVVHNEKHNLREIVTVGAAYAAVLGQMCEVIVVDNASTDGSVELLKDLTRVLPDLQVYVLSQKVSARSAERFGLESALGDTVCGSRAWTREELNMELQRPLKRGISIGSLFIGFLPEVPHVAQEFSSTSKTRRQRLNVEQAT